MQAGDPLPGLSPGLAWVARHWIEGKIARQAQLMHQLNDLGWFRCIRALPLIDPTAARSDAC